MNPKRPGYEVLTIGFDSKAVQAESGLLLMPQLTTAAAPGLDTLVIPGGRAMREAQTAGQAAAWISSQSRQTRRVAAVCTGVMLWLRPACSTGVVSPPIGATRDAHQFVVRIATARADGNTKLHEDARSELWQPKA